MEGAWRVVISIVLIAVLLGSVSIGVGLITGGRIDRVYSTLEGKYNISSYYNAYSEYLGNAATVIFGGAGNG